jgi:hypothetical protein
MMPLSDPATSYMQLRHRLSSRIPGYLLMPEVHTDRLIFVERGSFRGQRLMAIGAVGAAAAGILMLPTFRVPGPMHFQICFLLVSIALVLAGSVMQSMARVLVIDRQTGEVTDDRTRWAGVTLSSRQHPQPPRLSLHQADLVSFGPSPSWKGWVALLHFEDHFMALGLKKERSVVEAYCHDLELFAPSVLYDIGPYLIARYPSI